MKADYTNNRAALVKLVQKHLGEERMSHSLGVEREALKLAERYGADAAKAGLAGLLHDISKEMDLVRLSKKYGIVSMAEKTLHGPIAAAWLKDRGIVEDGEVLLAIKYHTTARADMTLLEKIVYIADYIEPERDFDGVEKLREYAYEDLDMAVLYGLENTMIEIVRRGLPIDLDSVEAYNCYRSLSAGQMLLEGES